MSGVNLTSDWKGILLMHMCGGHFGNLSEYFPPNRALNCTPRADWHWCPGVGFDDNLTTVIDDNPLDYNTYESVQDPPPRAKRRGSISSIAYKTIVKRLVDRVLFGLRVLQNVHKTHWETYILSVPSAKLNIHLVRTVPRMSNANCLCGWGTLSPEPFYFGNQPENGPLDKALHPCPCDSLTGDVVRLWTWLVPHGTCRGKTTFPTLRYVTKKNQSHWNHIICAISALHCSSFTLSCHECACHSQHE